MKVGKAKNGLFKHLDTVLTISSEKFSTNNRENHERMKWGRLVIQAVGVYGKLLETTELDKLMQEVEKIKKHIGMES